MASQATEKLAAEAGGEFNLGSGFPVFRLPGLPETYRRAAGNNSE
jgi:hypothetical protein